MVRLADRIVDIERGGNYVADRLAVLDGQRSVLTLGHHLEGAAVLGGDADADEAEPEGLHRRRDDPRHARLHTSLRNQTVVRQSHLARVR